MKLVASLGLLLGFFVAETQAASVVLYQTGWETAPANPAWTAGNVSPQNGWATSGDANSAMGNVVVANGSAEATIGGDEVTTPYGNAFHRFNASANFLGTDLRRAWPDISAGFAARPAGYDRVTASFDVFVPSTQEEDDSLYGLIGYNQGNPDFGVMVDPSFASVALLIDRTFVEFADDVVPFDTWFNLSVTANYQTGDVFGSLNGVPIPGLVGNSLNVPIRPLTHVALAVQNSTTSLLPRSAFTDNYRVVVEQLSVPRPSLSIARAGGSWTLSWDAAFANWILESSENIEAAMWRTENVMPSIAGDVASVTLPDEPPRRFYRLRQP